LSAGQQQPARCEAADTGRAQQTGHRQLQQQAQRDDARAVVAVDHVPGHQRTTGDYAIVADPAIVRDVAGRHDVVAVANFRDALRLRSP